MAQVHEITWFHSGQLTVYETPQENITWIKVLTEGWPSAHSCEAQDTNERLHNSQKTHHHIISVWHGNILHEQLGTHRQLFP
jgi:hypothetical protein